MAGLCTSQGEGIVSFAVQVQVSVSWHDADLRLSSHAGTAPAGWGCAGSGCVLEIMDRYIKFSVNAVTGTVFSNGSSSKFLSCFHLAKAGRDCILDPQE